MKTSFSLLRIGSEFYKTMPSGERVKLTKSKDVNEDGVGFAIEEDRGIEVPFGANVKVETDPDPDPKTITRKRYVVRDTRNAFSSSSFDNLQDARAEVQSRYKRNDQMTDENFAYWSSLRYSIRVETTVSDLVEVHNFESATGRETINRAEIEPEGIDRSTVPNNGCVVCSSVPKRRPGRPAPHSWFVNMDDEENFIPSTDTSETLGLHRICRSCCDKLPRKFYFSQDQTK